MMLAALAASQFRIERASIRAGMKCFRKPLTFLLSPGSRTPGSANLHQQRARRWATIASNRTRAIMGGEGGGILGPPLGKQESDQHGISRGNPGGMADGQGKIGRIPLPGGEKP